MPRLRVRVRGLLQAPPPLAAWSRFVDWGTQAQGRDIILGPFARRMGGVMQRQSCAATPTALKRESTVYQLVIMISPSPFSSFSPFPVLFPFLDSALVSTGE